MSAKLMGQMNPAPEKTAGFTLIELVVVIAILGIIAAFALPRFASLSQQAHDNSIQATAGAYASGVALVRAQYISNGAGDQEDVQGFGNDTVNVTSEGWPASAGADTNTSPTLDGTACETLWNNLMQANAPSIGDASATGVDYQYSVDSGDCIYTYQPDGNDSTIEYDADTGDVTTTINS